MKEELFNLLTYFIIYSFLGWVMESIFRSIIERRPINTGFLIGPFCPIYGFGACIMFLFLNNLSDNIPLLFVVSTIVLSIWEYMVGVLLEKAFHTKYWDYSNQKFNFQGRICLFNSLCWGLLGVVFTKYIHPFVQETLKLVDVKLLYYIIGIATIVLLVDFVVSVIKVKNIKASLEKVEKLNKEIQEKLKEIKLATKEDGKTSKKLDVPDVSEGIHELVEDLKKKRNRTILHLYRNVNRLKKAFPAIDTKEIREILNKKIEIGKIKELKKESKNKKSKKQLEK